VIGFELYVPAIALALVTVALLAGVQFLEKAIRALRGGDYEHGDAQDER
jgi:hypothetical protein